jgi:NAD(P)-dependent dehydrogenase (short-subunit alcohol dehydrogenase family)
VTLIAPVETIDETTLRKGFEVNVFGTLAVTRAFLPLLRQCHEESAQRPRPKVVLLSSLVGLLSMPYMSAYCATKFAVEAFGDGLRRELAHQGIDVSIIEPGAFASNLTAPLAGCIDDFKQTENRYYKIPYGRSLWLFDIGSKKLPGIKPVVDLLEGILLSRFPPARALIGFDAFALGLISAVLPDSVVDLAVRVVLGGVSAAKEKRS